MTLFLPYRRPLLGGPFCRNELWRRARAVPSLDQRFAEDKSLVDAVSGQQLITFSRASDATVTDSTGTLITVPSGTPRFDHNPTTGESLGLLVEEQRTNSIRNNTMVGAVAGTPGTLPTNWSTFTALTGLTREVVGVGTENGISYIDVRLSGTPSGSGVYLLNVESSSQVASSNGQSWTGSAYCKLQSGSLTGVNSLAVRTTALDGSFVELSVTAQAFTPTNAALGLQRIVASHTNTSASTVYEIVYFRITFSGAAIDFTLRIGMPQLEQGALATSVIPTSGTAVTRAADVASITGSAFSSWYNQAEGTVFCDAIEYPFASSVSRSFYQLHNSVSSNAEFIRQWIWNGNTSQIFNSVYASLGGPVSAEFSRARVDQLKKIALAVRANDFARSYNGEAVATGLIGNMPAGIDSLNIGSASVTQQLNGHIRRLVYWRERLANNVLQSITQ